MQQVCFVLMLIFAISFFLSSCFVHLFTFLSLFLHSREQWLKCAYIYYSFVVFILKTVSKSCLLTKNISNIEEVDDKNNTNVGYKTFHWKWAVKEHYGPSLRGKGDDWHIWYPKYCTQLDIFFGVWTTVYQYVLIIPKPTFFLVPFYNAGTAEFLSTVPWSDQIGTSDDYKIHLQV